MKWWWNAITWYLAEGLFALRLGEIEQESQESLYCILTRGVKKPTSWLEARAQYWLCGMLEPFSMVALVYMLLCSTQYFCMQYNISNVSNCTFYIRWTIFSLKVINFKNFDEFHHFIIEWAINLNSSVSNGTGIWKQCMFILYIM